MKYKGSTVGFLHQRNAEIMRTYRHVCSMHNNISLPVIAEEVVNSPCSRLWVSEERALIVYKDLLRGKPILSSMHPSKQDMFRELFLRVSSYLAKNPNDLISNAVFFAVNSPAPKFFMQPRSAIEIIHKMKKSRYSH